MRTARVMLTMAIAVLIATSVMAQEKAASKGKAKKLSPPARLMLRMDKFREALKGLDLAEEQKEKLNAIREDLAPKMKDAWGKLRDVLTEEQRAAVEESLRKAREAGKEGRALIRAVDASLTLTDEQKESMAKVTKEIAPLHRKMVKGVMAILAPEQREKVKKMMAPPERKKRKQGEKKDPQ